MVKNSPSRIVEVDVVDGGEVAERLGHADQLEDDGRLAVAHRHLLQFV